MSVAQRSEGVGRGMTCSPDDLPVTCSPDDHVMTLWSPPGDYLLFPLFGNLLFWMTPPPPPPVLVFYCLWSCIPTSLLMSTLLKLGFSSSDVKPRFGAFQCEYLLQNPLFFLRKIFLMALDTHAKKINPSSFILGGGVHDKTCWLIAYMLL